MSSSGLIFAMIVGAWAAYLVPMWLRRQDELNDSRPTERFSTAIRLLTRGKRAPAPAEQGDTAENGPAAPDAPDGSADLRAFAEPVTTVGSAATSSPAEPADDPAPGNASPTGRPSASSAGRPSGGAASGGPTGGTAGSSSGAQQGNGQRARVLARRRRTTMVLFLAFTLLGIFAVSTSTSLLWLPAIPGLLLVAYMVHLRKQERRRWAVAVDRRRAEEAARRLRERGQATPEPTAEPAPARDRAPARARTRDRARAREEPARAVVEQTDHAEWVDDQQRDHAAAPEDPAQGWDPAPVPLPTYVKAPVAPRTSRGVDLDAPDTWSAARSTTAGTPQQPPAPRAEPKGPQRTPLFDQYADDDRRRAAGE
ncbi:MULTISPECIES: divisome protein SepX/GlpR [Streptomyces]|uniref:divisome protein SepX/GlpR n=1 Tax=Streptomyces TaxID=1883 RepID=UPI001D04866E|nr:MULTISPECIES: gephyrin-like molybdotransferase receptor GlpR [Streptomyces]